MAGGRGLGGGSAPEGAASGLWNPRPAEPALVSADRGPGVTLPFTSSFVPQMLLLCPLHR